MACKLRLITIPEALTLCVPTETCTVYQVGRIGLTVMRSANVTLRLHISVTPSIQHWTKM